MPYYLTEVPAEFTVPLSDQTVPEKAEAVFECQVNKADAPVTWYVNGKVIKATPKKYKIVKEETVHKLIILDATPKDVAEYSAKVGKATTKAKLTVEGMQLKIVSIALVCLAAILSLPAYFQSSTLGECL